jgi:hypothetical protein
MLHAEPGRTPPGDPDLLRGLVLSPPVCVRLRRRPGHPLQLLAGEPAPRPAHLPLPDARRQPPAGYYIFI